MQDHGGSILGTPQRGRRLEWTSNSCHTVYHCVGEDDKRRHPTLRRRCRRPGGGRMWQGRPISRPFAKRMPLSTLRLLTVGSSHTAVSQAVDDRPPGPLAVTSLESSADRRTGSGRCARCGRDLSGTSGFALGGAVRCLRCALCYWPMLRRSAATALVVGTVLVAINQGAMLAAGALGSRLLWQIPLTYAVPFCVATWGALSNSKS